MGCACLHNRLYDPNGETDENKEIEEDPYNNNNNNYQKDNNENDPKNNPNSTQN